MSTINTDQEAAEFFLNLELKITVTEIKIPPKSQ